MMRNNAKEKALAPMSVFLHFKMPLTSAYFRTNYDAAEIHEWYSGFIEVTIKQCKYMNVIDNNALSIYIIYLFLLLYLFIY